jgi:myo-inositol 2-dehydrogenase / D-chiro-inositol 1-dehydrogenase
VELGLVGCGSRGNWITPLFQEFTGARLVAVADVVKAKLDATRDKFKVDAGRAYYGPQAYAELASSKLDVMVIETPPYYHPEQAMAAVDAGKHVYLAKPVAVDVPGCKTIEAAGKKARGRGQLPGRFPDPRTAGVSGTGATDASRRHRQDRFRGGAVLRRPALQRNA